MVLYSQLEATADRGSINGRKRSHQRYQLRDQAYVAVKGSSPVFGSVCDLSQGGVAIKCTHYDDLPGLASGREAVVDLFEPRSGRRVKDIPCRVVYEEVLSDTDSQESVSRNFALMRCGIQFLNLHDTKGSELQDFLANHALGI